LNGVHEVVSRAVTRADSNCSLNHFSLRRQLLNNAGVMPSRGPLPHLGPRLDLLDRPAVAVRVAKEHERAPREVLDLADVDAAARELGVRGLDVGDHELESLNGPRGRIGDALPLPDRDRACRARGVSWTNRISALILWSSSGLNPALST
jgi:hypothetical protein